jgi:hypothetical protein
MALLANVALTNTFDTWRLRTNALLTRVNAYTINESSLYANTLTANVRFVSSGATKLGTTGSTRTIVNGLLSANGNLNVAANTTVLGSMGLGTTTVNARLSMDNAVATNGYDANKIRFYESGNTIYGIAVSAGALGYRSDSHIFYTGAASPVEQLRVASSGLVTAAKSIAVTQNLTVSGNTTLNGTTTDKSDALNQTLTDAATISWDTSLGRVATVTLGASRTIAAPTNQKVGTYILRVVQGGTGSYTLTWNGNFKWTAQTAPVLSTAVGAVDIFTFFSDGSKMYGSYLPDVR